MSKIGKKKCLLVTCFVIVLIFIISAILLALLWPKQRIYVAKKYSHAAVATDAEICSKIGADVLKKNGSVIDAAIATVICTGVANPHSCGIGGDSFLLYYERKTRKFKIYDFRSVAPSSVRKDVYEKNPLLARYGGLSIAVPGQIRGLWLLHQKYGKQKWSDLIEPSVKLAEDGFPVTSSIHHGGIMLAIGRKELSNGLRKMITDSKGNPLDKGDIIKNPQLAETLRKIQKDPERFYDGDLAKDIVEDIQNAGGNVSLEDLKNYDVKEREVFSVPLINNLTFNTMSAPGGGPIAAMILNIMKGYNYTGVDFANSEDQFTFYQHFVESMKFSYAQRGYLGDPDFLPKENITKFYETVLNETAMKYLRDNKIFLNQTHQPSYYGGSWGKEDYGTSHTSILGENGDAVSVTSTINYLFGSLMRSEKTGIIYNNAMEDFSIAGVHNIYNYPPSVSNYVEPGKRPLSSLCPSIVTDGNGDVQLVIGAAGGSRAISGTAEVTLKTLFLGLNIADAISSYRLHHQGIPNVISYNVWSNNNNFALLDKLETIGHKFEGRSSLSIVQAIYRDHNGVFAMTDPSKASKPDGY